jgi:hypothetical protein
MSNSGSLPDQPTEPQPREIGDDEYLSQYGLGKAGNLSSGVGRDQRTLMACRRPSAG